MIKLLRSNALYCAWLIACLGTLLSLFYSYILNVEPCILCYYQRICLFPLTIILGIASYHNDVSIKKYVLPLALIGLFISLYQVCLQEIPGMQIDICGHVSCSRRIFLFGSITIPMASALGFCAISCLLIFAERDRKSL
ncbi:disulfide bond formation protein B [Chlamydia sp. 17-3921]|uniref:disulfide bond formation protein B n=1 Tax=Chlamydia sp. 17-3921 TaxID=2675798 RepID=UPI001919F769|nr:disulfide bond formation protein B [Chlamydia sp. 17-3921]